MFVSIFIAGVLAVMACIGHFTVGVKLYLKPLLAANMDQIAQKVLHTLFHYVSVFMVLSALILLMVGIRGEDCLYDTTMVLTFIAYNYALFALTQIVIVLKSGINRGLVKMFQWVFWLLIACLIFSHLY